jgi:hypothetical protein
MHVQSKQESGTFQKQTRDAFPHPLHRLAQQIFLPGGVPFGAEVRNTRVRDAFDGRGRCGFICSFETPVGGVGRLGRVACFLPLPKLILDTPAGQVEQPGFESAYLRIISKLR